MPQLTKGGKYIFGWSIIKSDFSIQLPKMAIEEYSLMVDGKVFLMSGSKRTGGVVVTRKGLLYDSKIGNILKETPALSDYATNEGEFVKYKGRLYCWCRICGTGKLRFSQGVLQTLGLEVGNRLLSIRSSDIAFCMGLKGPLIERARNHKGTLEVF